MKTLEDLKAALASEPELLWEQRGAFVSRTDNDVVAWCQSADGGVTVRRAHLITLMHNALPALIECAEALQKFSDGCIEDGVGTTDYVLAALAKLEKSHETANQGSDRTDTGLGRTGSTASNADASGAGHADPSDRLWSSDPGVLE